MLVRAIHFFRQTQNQTGFKPELSFFNKAVNWKEIWCFNGKFTQTMIIVQKVKLYALKSVQFYALIYISFWTLNAER